MARTIAKDHDEKRRLILDTAARLFARDGFDRASVSKLARACNISKANIYHYYSGKDAILFDILESHLSALRDRVISLDHGDADAETAFRRTVTEILLAYQGADNEHRLQVNAIDVLPKSERTALRNHQRDLVAHMSGLVQAIAPNVFAGDPAKLRATTMSVFGMLNWFYMWNRSAGRKAREDYAVLVCKLCLQGIPGV